MSDHQPYHALSVIPNIDQLILDAIAAGRSLKSIADQYGVTDPAILKRARQHEDYRDRLEIGLELRMDKREEELEKSTEKVSVSRADRLLSHARWMAERCAPARFGATQKIAGHDGGPLTVELVRFAGRTLEGETVSNAVDNTSEGAQPVLCQVDKSPSTLPTK